MTFFLTLLLVFLLVRYVLPRVLRSVLGSVVRQQMHKARQQGFGGFAGQPRPAPRPSQPDSGPRPGGPNGPTPAGQVRIDYIPPQPKAAPREFKGGDYVEYEES